MKKTIVAITFYAACFYNVEVVFAQCNTWVQKADFGGIARSGAVGFSIGSKGYIGTGWDGGTKKKRLLGI